MGYVIFHMVFFSVLLAAGYGEKLEEPVIPQPYSFSYAAGRAPGHIDRVHSETSDGNGVVRGSFSYLDPRYQVRTVQYVADQNGFRPVLTNPVRDTEAVALAKQKHEELYGQIAAERQRMAEKDRLDYDDGSYRDEYPPLTNVIVRHPKDTPVVENAKLKHLNLYERIAREHARIAAERKIDETEENDRF